ncbi:MAG: deiodinase-like protein [Candidatus Neomarinimicrobiota bacterium]|nr:deiodinase-like protein [Candidatus Neomarinimicrobiota bacterium]
MEEITSKSDPKRREIIIRTIGTHQKKGTFEAVDPVPELSLLRLKDGKEPIAAAQLCSEKLGLTILTIVDGMDNSAAEILSAWPERIYILHKGVIHYKGGPGPYEFNPPEAMESQKYLLFPH